MLVQTWGRPLGSRSNRKGQDSLLSSGFLPIGVCPFVPGLEAQGMGSTSFGMLGLPWFRDMEPISGEREVVFEHFRSCTSRDWFYGVLGGNRPPSRKSGLVWMLPKLNSDGTVIRSVVSCGGQSMRSQGVCSSG